MKKPVNDYNTEYPQKAAAEEAYYANCESGNNVPSPCCVGNNGPIGPGGPTGPCGPGWN